MLYIPLYSISLRFSNWCCFSQVTLFQIQPHPSLKLDGVTAPPSTKKTTWTNLDERWTVFLMCLQCNVSHVPLKTVWIIKKSIAQCTGKVLSRVKPADEKVVSVNPYSVYTWISQLTFTFALRETRKERGIFLGVLHSRPVTKWIVN